MTTETKTACDSTNLALEVAEIAKWYEWDTISYHVYDAGISGSEHAQRMKNRDRYNEIEQLIGEDAAAKAWAAGQKQFRAEVAKAIRDVVKDEIVAAWLAGDDGVDVIPGLRWGMLPARELAPAIRDDEGGLDTSSFDQEKLKAEYREIHKQICWRDTQRSVCSEELMPREENVWSEKAARCDVIAKVIGAEAAKEAMNAAQRHYRAEVAAKVKGIVPEGTLNKWLAGDQGASVSEAVIGGLKRVMTDLEGCA